MNRIYERMAAVTLAAGVLFGCLEVVYGYFFRVWAEAYDGVSRGYDAMHYPTKLGETLLFGFLALFLPVVSLAASNLARRDSRS